MIGIGTFKLLYLLVPIVIVFVLFIGFLVSMYFQKRKSSKKESMEEEMEEAMFQVIEASKMSKSAIVVIPDESDIPVYEKLVESGKLKKNPLGSGYMLAEDHEKVWSNIPKEHVHPKFEPDDGVLTKDIDPKTGKLVPVITEQMLKEDRSKVKEIIENKIKEVEKIRPEIEMNKKKIAEMFAKDKEK